jgi:hypothetical protein
MTSTSTPRQFEAIALAHLRELWTGYGNLTEIWSGEPRAGLPLSAGIHLNALNGSYDRMCLCARSVEMGA